MSAEVEIFENKVKWLFSYGIIAMMSSAEYN